MFIQEISPEQFAELFHHYHEALAPDFEATGNSHTVAWRDLPRSERSCMIAAVRLALLDLHSSPIKRRNHREDYFAKPGEAEWGS
ncbi:MAG: hypothetical protein CXZ00_14270 [Acidobacteria bacterium]|nr:MAG: hypothetical protein CXZ00_14270 [Acidobacteriota bacterium]